MICTKNRRVHRVFGLDEDQYKDLVEKNELFDLRNSLENFHLLFSVNPILNWQPKGRDFRIEDLDEEAVVNLALDLQNYFHTPCLIQKTLKNGEETVISYEWKKEKMILTIGGKYFSVNW